jgi:hypothetical protein
MTATTSQIDHPIGADGLFVLRLRDGDARLRGVDGETVRVSSDVDLEEVFTVDRGAGSLAIVAGRGFDLRIGRRRTADPRIDVDLPRGATVILEGASGDLAADALTGDQRYHTVSGAVSLSAVAGTVAVQAVSGDVSIVAGGDLDLEAQTVSGDLEIRAGRIRRLVARTTSGDVRIGGELVADVTHRIETVSGDMLVAPVGGVRLEATTVAGDVRSDVAHRSEGGRGRRVLVVGNGRATLATRSMSGSVRIVEARQLRTEPPPPPEPQRRAEAPRPSGPPPAPKPPTAIATAYDEERLRVLRSLERGEIDVTEASRRLELLDAGDVAEVER